MKIESEGKSVPVKIIRSKVKIAYFRKKNTGKNHNG
jgi:hypothetical protein